LTEKNPITLELKKRMGNKTKLNGGEKSGERVVCWPSIELANKDTHPRTSPRGELLLRVVLGKRRGGIVDLNILGVKGPQHLGNFHLEDWSTYLWMEGDQFV